MMHGRKELMMLVADILAAKSDSVVTTNPNERVAIVTHRLRAKQIGAAVVSQMIGKLPALYPSAILFMV